jgi:hypothetical protein
MSFAFDLQVPVARLVQHAMPADAKLLAALWAAAVQQVLSWVPTARSGLWL